MSILFAETLKKLRTERGLSQRELSEQIHITRSTVARWESGSRMPDVTMISRLSQCLGVDINTLINAAEKSGELPNVIMVDDRKIILSGGMPILKQVMPHSTITGFTSPAKAIEYAKANRVALAFLDIELGKASGLELCRSLLDINPRTNVVYLTAYPEYSLDAWSTGASGFMLKPITPEGVKQQLKKLRFPFLTGGANV